MLAVYETEQVLPLNVSLHNEDLLLNIMMRSFLGIREKIGLHKEEQR